MNHASLFSGFGGPDLAAEWLGWKNVFQCEWEDFPRKVLQYHFPDVDLYKDIRDFDATKYEGTVDVISGGFPCQPFSQAGQRKGKSDDRYLWPEMLRIIKEVKPRWVVGENVAGLVTMDNGKVLDHILSSLEDEGYKSEIYLIPACAVGAPHRRDRIWIVGHADGIRSGEVRSYFEHGQERRKSDDIGQTGGDDRKGNVANADNARTLQRLRTDGNRSPEDEGRQGQPQSELRSEGSQADSNADSDGRSRRDFEDEVIANKGRLNAQRRTEQSEGHGNSSNAKNSRSIGRNRKQGNDAEGSRKGNDRPRNSIGDDGNGNASNAESKRSGRIRNKEGQERTQDGNVVPGIEPGIQDEGRFSFNATSTGREKQGKFTEPTGKGRISNPGSRWDRFPTESPVCGRNDGLSFGLDGITFSKWRTESVKGFGNAIVPQVIYEIFRAIELYELELINK